MKNAELPLSAEDQIEGPVLLCPPDATATVVVSQKRRQRTAKPPAPESPTQTHPSKSSAPVVNKDGGDKDCG